ncbi:tRNA methyltransferase, partial [candidate division MSBL1 archaeon SCGC-AAA261D19]
MKKGDRILLDEEGNKYLVKLADGELHTDLGVVDLGEVIGKDPGDRVESHLGNEFVVLLPSPIDYLQKIKRKSQIILPKDAAQIVAHTGVGPGNHVVDAGAGSGALAIFLGNLVRPNGWVISYEIRKDFAKVAKENIEMSGLGDIVEVKIENVYEGI